VQNKPNTPLLNLASACLAMMRRYVTAISRLHYPARLSFSCGVCGSSTFNVAAGKPDGEAFGLPRVPLVDWLATLLDAPD
jgi:hypothetical protein